MAIAYKKVRDYLGLEKKPLYVYDIQQQLESLATGRFTEYDLDHLHATLVASLRGRYRDFPPLHL